MHTEEPVFIYFYQSSTYFLIFLNKNIDATNNVTGIYSRAYFGLRIHFKIANYTK